MSDSKSGSKNDLNESNLPLLEEEKAGGGETPEKEQIELEDTAEKEDSGTEKKKEKKKKEKKEKKEKGPSCIDTMTTHLNLSQRDGNKINEVVDLDFDDVLAEPDSTQGFDGIWKLSFVVFTQAKLWFYRLFAALIAIPASLLWALVFSLVTVLYVWVLAPVLRLYEFVVFVVRRVFQGLMRCTVEPICSALGTVFSQVSVTQNRNFVLEA